MRSRYSAYVHRDADYLIKTWHPDCQAQEWRDAIVESFEQTEWLGLRVISSSHAKNPDEAYVEFSACFIDEKLIINSLFTNVPVFFALMHSGITLME